MRATATFRLPDGSLRELGPGDLVGRLWSAALKLDDARISEAHAMVSLRGQELQLLALRGRFAVAHQPATSVRLRPGLEIELARGLSVTVEELTLPSRVLAVEAEGLPRQALAGVCGVRLHPRPALIPGYRADVDVLFWSDGDQWRARPAGGAPRVVGPGDVLAVGGVALHLVAVDLDAAAQAATRVGGRVHCALRIVARHDTCHVLRDGEPPLALSGLSARMLSELAAIGAPVGWEALAGELWPDEEDRDTLRRRFDISLSRLRRKLREARVRPDLVRADGFGHYELLLADGDRVVDET
jgi:hypothetical protein